MSKSKKILALVLSAAMSLSLLAGCGGGNGGNASNPGGSASSGAPTGSGNSGAAGSVYYLNFKPEQDGDWQELAKLYTQETGVEVKVQTAASGQYETTLMSEIAKRSEERRVGK